MAVNKDLSVIAERGATMGACLHEGGIAMEEEARKQRANRVCHLKVGMQRGIAESQRAEEEHPEEVFSGR